MPKIIQNPEQLILAVAREILKEDGYRAMNVRAISKKSGVSIGTIYNYFPDKTTLDYRVMDLFWSGYEEDVKLILRNEAPILVQIRACYDVLEDHLGRFLELFSIKRSGHVSKTCKNSSKEALIRRVSQILSERLIETCELDAVISADELACFIINTHVQMVSYQIYDYDLFEKILKKLLVIK